MHAPAWASAGQQIAGWWGYANAIWQAGDAVIGAGVLALRSLGGPVVFGCVAAVALGYALCVALGTACVRLAFARR